MAYIVADRVKETTTVTGTGPATLAGAASGYRSFASQLSIGDTCAYVIVNSNGSEWETGIGTYSAVNTLTRTTVQASTNANAAVVFTAGVKDVFMGPTADSLVDYNPVTGAISNATWNGSTISTSKGGTGLTTLGTANQALAVNSAGTALEYHTVVGSIASADGSVTVSQTGQAVDLSVAVAAATTNVIVQVRNNTGTILTKGTVVYINSAIGQTPTVAKALATSDATSAQTLGMLSADLGINAVGPVTIIGLIDDVNTGAYQDGDQLYLSSTTAGQFTATKPYAPAHLVYVGVVEYAHAVHGKIFVKVQNGYELDELHNVAAQSPSNGQTIVYNSSNQLWEKNTVSLTAGVNGTLPVANGGTGSTTASGARTNLGLVIGTDVLAPTGSAASLTNFPTLNQNTTGTAANVTGIVAVANGGTGVTTSTGTGSVVLSNAPTLTTATFAAGTISASAPNAITQTWNNAAVAFSGLTMNVTDAASATASYLIDLQIGGSSRFRIRKDGTPFFTSNIAAIPSVSSITWYGNSGATTQMCQMSVSSFTVPSSSFYGWIGNNSGIYQPVDHTYEYRGGTNAQTFRVYNTYTDASNYERLGISWASNICTISPENAGTGVARRMRINFGDGGNTNIQSTSVNNINIVTGGVIAFASTNGELAFRPTYGGSLTPVTFGQGNGGNTNRTGDSYVFRITGGSGNTDPGYIGFGAAYVPVGATSTTGHTQQDALLIKLLAVDTTIAAFGASFASTVPAIKRVGTKLQARLADDSGYATWEGPLNSNAVSAIALPTAATVTAAIGDGTTVTYTAANTFSVGQVVSITGLTTTTGSSLNLSNQTITTASATQFTVANTTSGTAAATQAGTATIQSAGNSVTITAGNGSGVGAGGNIILQPGDQGTSGGRGIVYIKAGGAQTTGFYSDPTQVNNLFVTSGTNFYSAGGNGNLLGWYNVSAVHFNITGYTYIRANANSLGMNNVTNTEGLSLSFKQATTNISANTNDLVLSTTAFKRLNCTVACSLTGIAPVSGSHEDGRMIRIYNVGTANLTLSHNSASSTAANRMFSSTGADIVLAPNDYAELIWDGTNNGSGGTGWRVS